MYRCHAKSKGRRNRPYCVRMREPPFFEMKEGGFLYHEILLYKIGKILSKMDRVMEDGLKNVVEVENGEVSMV